MAWESTNLTRINASVSQSGALTVFVQILENLEHPFMHSALFFDSGKGGYDFEILNRTVNLCEFFRNTRYEPLLQIFYKILLENGPWPTTCPIRKVVYTDD